MVVTVVWLLLLAATVAFEWVCRRSAGRWTSLTSIGTRVWSRPAGRIALIVIWAFVGWHVFARYTLPR
ncbi:MAG: DUF6186 family protein [Acidimicrobiales bacterium]|jgi:hypothetical protein